MKVIVAGATGFVGNQTLLACIAHPRISEIIVLTRRQLSPELTSHAKVKVKIHNDFSQYPDELLNELSDASTCLWSIGGKASDFPDVETAKRVQYEYTTTFAAACARSLVPSPTQKQFRFIFCSGALAERDQSKQIWFLKDTRRIKGLTESELIHIEEKNPGFHVNIVRPAGILAKDSRFLSVIAPGSAINVADLATVMTDIAIQGYDQQIIENKEIIRYFKRLQEISKETSSV